MHELNTFNQNYFKIKFIQPLITFLCLLAVPLLMAFQNWDDHDRSNRYTAQSFLELIFNQYKKIKEL